MDAVVATVDPPNGVRFLAAFYRAHFLSGNFAKAALVAERRADMLGSLRRLRDQGECMGWVANALDDAGDVAGARKWTCRARSLGEAHGFFSVEAAACHRLAKMDLDDGKIEEGMEMLRHTLKVTEFVEEDSPQFKRCEVAVLLDVMEALFDHYPAERAELDTMLARYEAAAKALSLRSGTLCSFEFLMHDFRAKLYKRRGKKEAYLEEFKTIQRLTRLHPLVAGQIVDMDHASGMVRSYLLDIRAQGLI